MWSTPRLIIFCFVLLSISFLILPTTSSDSFKIEGKFALNNVLKDTSHLEPTTKVVLDGGKYSTFVRKDGKFVIDNVPPGSYLFEVLSRKFIYPRLRVDVDSNGEIRPFVTIIGSEWSNQGPSLPYPLELFARAPADYFIPREGFSITSLLFNPYIILMGFGVILLLVMPKMMANLDQAALQELQQNQAQNPFDFDLSSSLAKYLSGGNEDDKSSNNKRN
ncbi:putative membrane protein [Gigaspora margarita]|uniref:Putative membrane protein n=1 Tax=Gigaspora margarita TaxID=4874 RepID=A0A8H3WWW5_GIGMA|nr:putative membrane protein [Gigaspora margarita]